MEAGKSYEELHVGKKESFCKTIAETDIAIYATLTGDFNPIHMDSEYARKTRFKERIAHGPLTLGFIAPVIGMKLPGLGAILLEINARFLAPVKIGDTITAEVEVLEKLEKHKFVKLKLCYFNQDGIEVISGSTLVLPPRK